TWESNNATYAKESITIRAMIFDASGVDQTWIRWPVAGGWSPNILMNDDGGSDFSKNVSFTIDVSALPEGVKNVQIWAEDLEGNNTGWRNKGSFTADRTAPAIDWDNKNAQYAKTSITIDANVSDAVSGVADVLIWWPGAAGSVSMNKVSGDRYRYTIDTSQLPAGEKEVQILARDKAGNDTKWQVKGRFLVDRLPPKIEWDNNNPQYTKDEITIKTNVSDKSSGVANVWIWWTGALSTDIKMKKGSGNQYEYTIPALQEDGLKDVQIYATDNAGNTTNWVSKGSFIVDRTPPIVNWLEPLNQAVLSDGRIHLAGNIVDDNPDYVVIEWQEENAAAWQSHTIAADPNHSDFQYDLSGLTQGINYRLRLRATDKAGNDADDTPSRTVIGQLPADTMLRLQLESMQADWKYTQGTAFDYRITVRALKSALSDIALRYTLPAGLQKNGAVHIDGDGAAAMKLNPNWGGPDAQLLLPTHGAMLAARNAFTVIIPVRIVGTAVSGTFIQSEVQASANNLIGRISAIHRITLEGPPFDEEQLRLKKTVDKETASPGEILRYTITFTNVSTEDLNTLVIKDDIQSAYLTLRNAQCGQSIPDSLQCCVSTEQGDQCGTAIERKPGALEWHLNGILAAGDSGSVSYEAQVNQK
ncbi:MAG TPA: Ig-like domain-containing protein, partial [Herbaspirillum sp.]|nr:Ig-like domain-containing protein [Herbaspirillum sp.]